MSSDEQTRHLPESVIVGRVRKPHGVRGEVAVETDSDVGARFRKGSRMSARFKAASARQLVVASCRRHGDVCLVRFEGYDDRERAEELRAARLEVARSEVPSAPEGAYYYYELIGCRCVDRREGDIGRIRSLIEDGGGLLLDLESSGSRRLVPFVQAYLGRVDIETGVVEVDLPPGLVETCTSTS